jgi:hypothetical protein
MEAQCHHHRPLPTCQPRPTCYCTVKKLQKKQHFHTTISLKSITMAFFSRVGKEWCVTATKHQQEPRYSVSMGSNAI